MNADPCRPAEFAHLIAVLNALVEAGNVLVSDGFTPNQGGVDCYVRDPLDVAVINAVIADDPHRSKISVTDRALDCLRCWAGIHVA
jgi:hypothetical protein